MATGLSTDLEKPPTDGSGEGAGLRYLARQPIMDERGVLHGYELLFRSGAGATAFSGDGNAATRTMLDNTLIFGLERLTGGMPVFVNCTQEALEGRLVMVLPPEQTVLEVLETLDPTVALLAACGELKHLGYRIALDDFEWSEAWEPFVELADYVKVDMWKTTPEARAQLLKRLRGRPVQLVAERVETQAELEKARQEGFSLFQGYYFCRPVLMQNRAVPANRLVHLELLQVLHGEFLDTRRISNLVKRDASLTYRLLRLVNSPMYGMGTVIRSIQSALVLIGDAMFRRVAILAIASELGTAHSMELLRMAFLRGRFCELAAPLWGGDATEQYLLGIVSLMPAMLQVPMERIADVMPLRGEVRQALLGEDNRVRTVLRWLEDYELGRWAHCDALAGAAQLEVAELTRIYEEAVLWAEANLSLAAATVTGRIGVRKP